MYDFQYNFYELHCTSCFLIIFMLIFHCKSTFNNLPKPNVQSAELPWVWTVKVYLNIFNIYLPLVPTPRERGRCEGPVISSTQSVYGPAMPAFPPSQPDRVNVIPLIQNFRTFLVQNGACRLSFWNEKTLVEGKFFNFINRSVGVKVHYKSGGLAIPWFLRNIKKLITYLIWIWLKCLSWRQCYYVSEKFEMVR